MEIEKSVLPISSASLARIAFQYFSYLTRKEIDIKECNVFEAYPIEGNGQKTIEYIYSKYTCFLTQFGSAKNITENLHIFKDFPQNNNLFLLENASPYHNNLEIFQGTDGVKYMCKQDIFLYLQNQLISKDSRLEEMVPLSMLLYILKSQEKKLNVGCEFIPFDNTTFTKLDNHLDALIGDLDNLPPNVVAFSIEQYDWKSIFDQFENFLPDRLDDNEWTSLTTAVRMVFEDIPTEKRKDEWKLCYNISASLVTGLQKIMKAHPLIFLPREVNKDRSPPVVRLFEDGSQMFVIRFELERAMKFFNPRVSETQVLDRNRVECMDLDKAQSLCSSYGIRIERIPLVKIAIKRARYCAVPIMSPYTGHCVLVVDVLFRFLRDFFFGYRAFHGLPRNDTKIDRIVAKLNVFFDTSFKYRYFSSLGVENYMNKAFDTNTLGKTKPTEMKTITGGFNVEELKEELEYLQMNKFFPEILNYANVAHAEILKNKKEDELQTCDFLDAIEHCLRIFFFARFPNMAEFLHNQQGCHRIVGYKCKRCQKEKPLEKKKKIQAVYKILNDNILKCTQASTSSSSNSEKARVKLKNKKQNNSIPTASAHAKSSTDDQIQSLSENVEKVNVSQTTDSDTLNKENQ